MHSQQWLFQHWHQLQIPKSGPRFKAHALVLLDEGELFPATFAPSLLVVLDKMRESLFKPLDCCFFGQLKLLGWTEQATASRILISQNNKAACSLHQLPFVAKSTHIMQIYTSCWFQLILQTRRYNNMLELIRFPLSAKYTRTLSLRKKAEFPPLPFVKLPVQMCTCKRHARSHNKATGWWNVWSSSNGRKQGILKLTEFTLRLISWKISSLKW